MELLAPLPLAGQFNRIIRKHGWDELIRRMEERLAKGQQF